MTARFTEPEPDHAGEFRSKLIAGNNEIVAASEGYSDAATARRYPRDMLRWVVEANAEAVREAVIVSVAGYGGVGASEIADEVIRRLTAD